jgi:homogentisate 1,2-dioxygenase
MGSIWSTPFCERDFILPSELETHDELAILIKIKGRHDTRSGLRYASFDVVGWDGYNYPYGFSIHNFEPLQDGTSTATSTSNIRNFDICSVLLCP